VEYCEFAEDALYDLDNNVWIRFENSGIAKLGITSVHAALAGRLNQVKFKPVGSTVQKGQSVATIESAKYFGAVRTPVSGTIVEINDALQSRPKLANNYPYDDGWFVRIEPTSLEEDRKSLVDARSSIEKIKSQIAELRVRCFKAFPDYDMWEVGVECAAVLVRLNELMERVSLDEVVHIVSDDPTADIEMARWSDQTGQLVLETRKEGKLAHFIVRKVK